jgi:hypothetical protein
MRLGIALPLQQRSVAAGDERCVAGADFVSLPSSSGRRFWAMLPSIGHAAGYSEPGFRRGALGAKPIRHEVD